MLLNVHLARPKRRATEATRCGGLHDAGRSDGSGVAGRGWLGQRGEGRVEGIERKIASRGRREEREERNKEEEREKKEKRKLSARCMSSGGLD